MATCSVLFSYVFQHFEKEVLDDKQTIIATNFEFFSQMSSWNITNHARKFLGDSTNTLLQLRGSFRSFGS